MFSLSMTGDWGNFFIDITLLIIVLLDAGRLINYLVLFHEHKATD